MYIEIASPDRNLNLDHPNLHLTPEERRLFGQLFAAADSEKLGVVTGEVGVRFFEKTRLSPAVLGEVSTVISWLFERI
jgi:epidermal growth factor receptor substrate 15